LGIAHKLFTDPGAFVQAVATGHKGVYLALLLAPFLGLWLLEPLLLLGAVPDLAINLLSSKTDQTSIPFHWTAGIVPFVVAASIFGAARLKGRSSDLALWVLAGTAAVALYSPILALPGDVRALGSPSMPAMAHALSMIPVRAPVSASVGLGGHLSERRYVDTFPFAVRSRWIIVDANDPVYAATPSFKRKLRRYEADKAWRVVFSSHGITVLNKRSGEGS
jgi:hypothetical protein